MKHVLLAIFLCVPAITFGAGQKNVLLMISDNQSWFDVGCYGSKNVKTPYLDALAASGVRFAQGFATTASCGPSRAVMYTGLLTHSNGQYAHPHREHNQEIRPDVTTVFSMLKGNGYRTGLVGKDHIRPLEKYPIDFKPRGSSRDVVWMAEQAADFISSGDDPFFLVMSFSDPHPTSIDGAGWGIRKQIKGYEPEEYDPASLEVPDFLPDAPEVREGLAGYYQQISRMDSGVGAVLEALGDAGHAEDTLVIFISDHGTSEPGAMGTHYEPGVRIPFIVRSPAAKRSGVVSRTLVSTADLTPTILDWTGTSFGEYPLHGRSFLGALDDVSANDRDHVILSHVGHDVFAHYPMRTLRRQRYKLIWNVLYRAEYPLPIDTVQRRTWVNLRERGDKRIGARTVEAFLHRPQLELYDLKNDPWETNNLADSNESTVKAVRDEMVQQLVTELSEQGDPWLRKYHPLKPGQ